MKRFLFIGAIFAVLVLSSFTLLNQAEGDEVGYVIFDAKSDYHIIETKRFYVLVEWYKGPDFSRGDKVVGDLHSYGFKYVKVRNNTKETKIYIENYWTSKERCMEWLREHKKL